MAIKMPWNDSFRSVGKRDLLSEPALIVALDSLLKDPLTNICPMDRIPDRRVAFLTNPQLLPSFSLLDVLVARQQIAPHNDRTPEKSRGLGRLGHALCSEPLRSLLVLVWVGESNMVEEPVVRSS